MKRIILIIISSVFIVLTVNAQDLFSHILGSIENNNTTLKAYREKANADKIGNRTGINMDNPEVEFGYSWGSPKDTGNKTDWAVKQSFDFPTAYRYKSQLATGKNSQVDLAYDQQRRKILQQARLFCIDLAYQNKLNKELVSRLGHARELAEAYQKRFDRGDIDILELNKTKLSLLTAEKALQMNEVEINTLKSELQRLNGGQAITTVLNDYSLYTFPISFPDWFERVKENNPSLKMGEQEIMLSRKQEQLTKALNLPKITAGYGRESILGTVQQGVTVGVSIPLWQGRNTVKYQKAQTLALQMQQEDFKLQFRNILKNQYDKAFKLSSLLKEYQTVMSITNNQELLKKALDKGQLSLINYLLELSVYYETMDKYLETEKDFQLSIVELQQWER